jgi:hypothetical protein
LEGKSQDRIRLAWIATDNQSSSFDLECSGGGTLG